jgi:hypothetical protein
MIDRAVGRLMWSFCCAGALHQFPKTFQVESLQAEYKSVASVGLLVRPRNKVDRVESDRPDQLVFQTSTMDLALGQSKKDY